MPGNREGSVATQATASGASLRQKQQAAYGGTTSRCTIVGERWRPFPIVNLL
jgi:hypothetical protein